MIPSEPVTAIAAQEETLPGAGLDRAVQAVAARLTGGWLLAAS